MEYLSAQLEGPAEIDGISFDCLRGEQFVGLEGDPSLELPGDQSSALAERESEKRLPLTRAARPHCRAFDACLGRQGRDY